MMTSPAVFFNFCQNFDFLGHHGGKRPKMRKNSVCHALYLGNHTSYDLHLHLCKVIIYPFLKNCFQILIFSINSGVKGQKMAQNDKKLCLSHSISQEAYIICSSFLVHICEMMTSPNAFFIFSKLEFSRLLEAKRAKNCLK